jgi:site-specific DNA-methyltransferase (adenine-specific)
MDDERQGNVSETEYAGMTAEEWRAWDAALRTRYPAATTEELAMLRERQLQLLLGIDAQARSDAPIDHILRLIDANEKEPPPRVDHLYTGNCREILPLFATESIDLVVTSPPYADQRRNTYGGIHPDQYVEWFLPISAELLRALKPTGSFILNIKERVVGGERHTYVIELILAMRRQGWLWTEEYCWHKRNCYPGKWPNRFRDSWERCLHFTKQRQFKMHQEAVMVPVGEWAEKRLRKLSETDRRRDNSRVNSGFGKNISNWVGRELVYPTNVLHMATECSNRAHSAVFPVALPEWFIKLFTAPGDLVLDPFMGSGTSAVAAKRQGRHYVGIEVISDYVEEAEERLALLRQEIDAEHIMVT